LKIKEKLSFIFLYRSVIAAAAIAAAVAIPVAEVIIPLISQGQAPNDLFDAGSARTMVSNIQRATSER
jgi:hypothetical protein